MRLELFGLELTLQKAPANLVPVDSYARRPWTPIVVHEPFTGAWQQNLSESTDSVLAYFAVYACVTLIASDMGKMDLRLVQETDDGIWEETESAAFSPVIRSPNSYQNRVQWVQWWMTSKLIHGNTYALKARDGRGIVTALYLLDPCRVSVLVAPDRSVYYELKADNLAGLSSTTPVIVPAREIIHDRCNPLFHPLIGTSPLFAASLPALQGLKIQNNSLSFFANGSTPGGVLTAPGFISQEVADRVKAKWEAEYTGPDAAGKVAVLGDGMKYEAMTQTALNSQLIEQLRFSGEMVCSCYHVAPYLIGLGGPPSYNNVEAIQQAYLAQCLQIHVTNFQKCFGEGLELPRGFAVHFDLDDLLLMDTATKMDVAQKGVNAAVLTPNEARRRFNLAPKEGGGSPYLQQQYYSLEALAERDAATPPPPTPRPSPAPALPEAGAATVEKVLALTRKAWRDRA